MEIFRALDTRSKGFLTLQDFTRSCSSISGLRPAELQAIFEDLDLDRDGVLISSDFLNYHDSNKDFKWLSQEPSHRSTEKPSESNNEIPVAIHQSKHGVIKSRRKPTWNELIVRLKVKCSPSILLSSQDQICELYQELHEAGLHDVLTRFEDVVVTVIKDIHQKQSENERLERSYKREKEAHTKHLQQLEEDTETQAQKVEARVRKEEREKYEAEREALKTDYESEIGELMANLKRLQEQTPIQYEKPTDDQTLRLKLDEVLLENRSIKRQLNDAETSLALVRGEAANLKSLLKETNHSLEAERASLTEYLKDHENLSRQVQALQDANKKLHDTNDSLSETIESGRGGSLKRPYSVSGGRSGSMLRSISNTSKGEYVRKYIDSTDPERASRIGMAPSISIEGASLADELSMISGQTTARHLLPTQDSFEVDTTAEDIDSGHFTIHDIRDYDSDSESLSIHGRRQRGHARDMFRMSSTNGSELLTESFDEHGLGGGAGTGDDTEGGTLMNSRPQSSCSLASSRLGSDYFNGRSSKRGMNAPATPPTIPEQPAAPPPKAQEAERVFKIVLAGDAAVGKSSFIMRLCKNKFVSNLNSTLGVDFQTKTLEVDGRVIALQLWDTAGQERFRSIAKSYFRRADGVLLLYDVTYERSFLSVRDWLETIEDGAQKQIPIMIVGNKSDLRAELTAEGSTKTCVKMEDGQRLAREILGLFIETSAKDGSNVLEAVIELSRLLMTNEDLEVQSIGLKLQDVDTKKKSPCCNI